MQDYVHYLEEAWNLWFPLTLQNKEYALFLVVSTWLITAIFYSIRISFLKSKVKRTNNALTLADGQVSELKTLSEATALELQAAREESTTLSQQTEQLQGYLSGLEQQLRNKLQSLIEWATTEEDSEADTGEAVLQRLEQRVERLRSELQNSQKDNTRLEASVAVENAKNAEKDQEIQTLQSRLDSQSLQLSKLEISLTEYKSLETQQQIQQQRIADLEAKLAVAQATTLAPKPAAPAPVIEKVPEVTPVAAVDIDPVVVEVPKAPRSFNPFAAAPVTTASPAPQPEPVKPAQVAEPKAVTPIAPASAAKAESKKSGGLFGSMMRKLGSLDEKMGAYSNPPVIAEQEPENAEPVTSIPTPPAQPEPVAPVAAITEEKSESKGLKRLGGLFKKRG